MRRIRVTSLIIGAALATTLASGCTVAHVGVASPQPAPKATTSSPDRPRELKIDGFASCELLSESQRLDLQISRPPNKREDSVSKADACDFNNHTDGTSLSLYVMLKHDMEMFAPGNVNGKVRSVRVLGFPAYEIELDSREDPNQSCSVNIGVSSGQVLRGQYMRWKRQQPLPDGEVCIRATRGVELALGNILAKS
ncbi:DUF3558 domain-containing protein [Allokutzneria albata]|nr:DUF3558 domain-containing protein [Allokutzneria albata]